MLCDLYRSDRTGRIKAVHDEDDDLYRQELYTDTIFTTL